MFSRGLIAVAAPVLLLAAIGAFSGCTVDGTSGLFSLTVATSGSGSGTVAASGAQSYMTGTDGMPDTGAQIDCAAGVNQNCSALYEGGASVTLTAIPSVASAFMGWSGACTGTDLTCVVTVDQAKAVVAQFNLVTDNLQVTVTGSGSGTVTSNPTGIDCGNFANAPTQCSETVSENTPVVLIAAAQPNSKFAGWGGDCSGTSTSCVVVLNQAHSVTATFNVLDATAPLVTSQTLGGVAQGQVGAVGMNYYIAVQGIFPSTTTSNTSTTPLLGEIMAFAGNFTPYGWRLCDGSLLNISQNTALFSILGTTFGGDGQTTFALPDLRGKVPMGTGSLSNPSNPNETTGPSSVPLVSSLGVGTSGQGQIGVLGINYYVALQGIFPSTNSGNDTTGVYLGQLMLFAGNFTPGGWALCDGSLLNISQNTALFSLLGTTYGGNGTTNFAVPDLRSRVPMGLGSLANPVNPAPSPGAPSVPLVKTLSLGGASSGQVEALGINFDLAMTGYYPSTTTGGAMFYVGQMLMFAGNFAPDGLSPCNGATESISQNTAVFSLVGTTFGGNGTTNFALPDLSGRVLMGAQ